MGGDGGEDRGRVMDAETETEAARRTARHRFAQPRSALLRPARPALSLPTPPRRAAPLCPRPAVIRFNPPRPPRTDPPCAALHTNAQ